MVWLAEHLLPREAHDAPARERQQRVPAAILLECARRAVRLAAVGLDDERRAAPDEVGGEAVRGRHRDVAVDLGLLDRVAAAQRKELLLERAACQRRADHVLLAHGVQRAHAAMTARSREHVLDRAQVEDSSTSAWSQARSSPRRSTTLARSSSVRATLVQGIA